MAEVRVGILLDSAAAKADMEAFLNAYNEKRINVQLNAAEVDESLAQMTERLVAFSSTASGEFTKVSSEITQTFNAAGNEINTLVEQYRDALGQITTITRQIDGEGNVITSSATTRQDYSRINSELDKISELNAKKVDAFYGIDEKRVSKSAAESARVFTEAYEAETAIASKRVDAFYGMNNLTKSAEESAGVFSKGGTVYSRDSLDSGTLVGTSSLKPQTEELEEYSKSVDKVQTSASQATGPVSGFLKTLGTTAKFMASGAIIGAAVSAFSSGLETMKEVDAQMTIIQKVTGETDEAMQQFEDHAYATSSKYGRTVNDYLEMSTIFARAGYSGEALNNLSELALLLQNIGDIDADLASKAMITADKAWGLGGNIESLTGIIDGMNEVTNHSAVDMQGLTEAMTVAGSVFASSGEDAQAFTAMVGTGIATTQRSGSEVGRAMRTILMNLRQVKGEFADGDVIDAQSISKAAAALDAVGISVIDTNGELKQASDILGELHEKWVQMDEDDPMRSMLSQDIAGKLRANVFMALMDNWDEYEKQLALYADGAGSAMEENMYYLDSWEAKTNSLSTAWSGFMSQLINLDGIKGAMDGFTALLDMLNAVVTGEEAYWEAADTAAKSMANRNSWLENFNAGDDYVPIYGIGIGVEVEEVDGVQEAIDEAVGEVEGEIDQVPVPAIIDVETEGADVARSEIDSLGENKDVVVNVDADTSSARAQISALNSVSVTIQAKVAGLSAALGGGSTKKFASGTANAASGDAMVNERGAELIVDNGRAYIANGGLPTITTLSQGAVVYNAKDTKKILSRSNVSSLNGSLPSFASGSSYGVHSLQMATKLVNSKIEAKKTTIKEQATQKKAQQTTASNSSSYNGYSSSSASGGSGGSGGSAAKAPSAAQIKKNHEDEIKHLKDVISLRKSELKLLEAKDAPVKEQIDKQRQIQDALMSEINHMKAIGSKQEDINALYTEWYNINEDIKKLQQGMLDDISKAIDRKVSELNDTRKKEIEQLDEQIDAIKKEKEEKEDELSLEEKILAVEEAEKKLEEAKNNRNVRYYNAITGQWEWAANVSNVKNAQDELDNARKALQDYQDDADYEARIQAIEDEKKAIEDMYDEMEEKWKKISEQLEEPKETLEEALSKLGSNVTAELLPTVNELNKMLDEFGYNVKYQSFTEKGVLYVPVSKSAFADSVEGTKNITKSTRTDLSTNHVGDTTEPKSVVKGNQYNGDVFNFDKITLTESQAESTSVASLVRMSKGLNVYSA